MNAISMAKNFEDRFFELWQSGLDEFKAEVRSDIKGMSAEVTANTKVTEKLSGRVDKLDGKVFAAKRPNAVTSILGDKTIITTLAIALMVFLLIAASVLHVKVPIIQ